MSGDPLSALIKSAQSCQSLFSLSRKTALVVGGTKGLGQAMAIALAASGADVCVVSRGPDGLSETSQAICELGRSGTHFAADVTDEAQVESVVEMMLHNYGQIDILVNSQGITHTDPIADFDTDTWERVIDVNLKSVFLCCKHVGRSMLKQRKGKIINVSSVRGFQGRAEDPAYAPSKGAVNLLTRSLAIEWGPKGINVNGIAPTFTRTEMSSSIINDRKKAEWILSRIPLGRMGELEDLFGPVIFLASEASNMVNGHILPVDGGWLAA